MSFKKIMGQIHLWLGLASGLVVFILGITGCMLSYEEEITPWLYADKMFVTPTGKNKVPLGNQLQLAQEALGDSIPVENIRIKNQAESSYIFTNYTSRETPTGIWYGDDVKYSFWVYINPYTGKIIELQDHTFEFFRVINVLHWRLFFINKIGQPITGISTLIFLITLITGLVLWWPKNKRSLKASTWFRWKSTTKWKRKNYDLHNIIGFYSMFLVVFIAITGLIWAFDWAEDSMRWIANSGQTLEKERISIQSTPLDEYSNPLDIIFNDIQTRFPDAYGYSFNLPEDSLDPIRTSIDYDSHSKGITLYFDQYSGKQLHYTDWNDKNNGDKVRAYNKDIHIGAIGGIIGKTIAFFLSLFAASLPVTGFLIWYGRKFKSKKSLRRRKSAKIKKHILP